MIVNGPNNAVLTHYEIFGGMKNGQLDYQSGYKLTLEKVEFFGNIAVTWGRTPTRPLLARQGQTAASSLHQRLAVH